MTLANRQLRLQARPKGLLAPGDLQLTESPVQVAGRQQPFRARLKPELAIG